MINRLIEASGEKLVMRKKVREILFEGYHVKLFQEINGMTSRFNIPFPSPLPNNTFGAFYGKNGTSPGVYTSYTGVGNVMDLKSIITFRQRTKVPHWTGDTCNQLMGTDGSAFHPKVKRKETLYLFNVDLCRLVFCANSVISVVFLRKVLILSLLPSFPQVIVYSVWEGCFCSWYSCLQVFRSWQVLQSSRQWTW